MNTLSKVVFFEMAVSAVAIRMEDVTANQENAPVNAPPVDKPDEKNTNTLAKPMQTNNYTTELKDDDGKVVATTQTTKKRYGATEETRSITRSNSGKSQSSSYSYSSNGPLRGGNFHSLFGGRHRRFGFPVFDDFSDIFDEMHQRSDFFGEMHKRHTAVPKSGLTIERLDASDEFSDGDDEQSDSGSDSSSDSGSDMGDAIAESGKDDMSANDDDRDSGNGDEKLE